MDIATWKGILPGPYSYLNVKYEIKLIDTQEIASRIDFLVVNLSV